MFDLPCYWRLFPKATKDREQKLRLQTGLNCSWLLLTPLCALRAQGKWEFSASLFLQDPRALGR